MLVLQLRWVAGTEISMVSMRSLCQMLHFLQCLLCCCLVRGFCPPIPGGRCQSLCMQLVVLSCSCTQRPISAPCCTEHCS